MKFERNQVINDYVRVSTSANGQVAAMLAAIMVNLQSRYSNLGESLTKVVHI